MQIHLESVNSLDFRVVKIIATAAAAASTTAATFPIIVQKSGRNDAQNHYNNKQNSFPI